MTSTVTPGGPIGPPGGPDSRPGRRALSDWALSQLYEMIFSGRLVPGDALGEVEITELLGVSRSPIRDALRQLEESGLVEVSPSNGRRTVRRFGVGDIFELYTIRVSLESLGVRAAADRITDDELAEIEGYLSEMVRSAQAPRLPGHDYEADFRLHESICRAARMPRLLRLLSVIWLQTRALLHHLDITRVYPTTEELAGAADDHARIVERLRAHDADGSAVAIRRHLELRRDHLIDAVKRHGGIV